MTSENSQAEGIEYYRATIVKDGKMYEGLGKTSRAACMAVGKVCGEKAVSEAEARITRWYGRPPRSLL